MRTLNPRSLNPSLLNSCFIEGELAPLKQGLEQLKVMDLPTHLVQMVGILDGLWERWSVLKTDNTHVYHMSSLFQ